VAPAGAPGAGPAAHDRSLDAAVEQPAGEQRLRGQGRDHHQRHRGTERPAAEEGPNETSPSQRARRPASPVRSPAVSWKPALVPALPARAPPFRCVCTARTGRVPAAWSGRTAAVGAPVRSRAGTVATLSAPSCPAAYRSRSSTGWRRGTRIQPPFRTYLWCSTGWPATPTRPGCWSAATALAAPSPARAALASRDRGRSLAGCSPTRRSIRTAAPTRTPGTRAAPPAGSGCAPPGRFTGPAVGTLDPVLDGVRGYAGRPRAAGNTVELVELPGLPHGAFPAAGAERAGLAPLAGAAARRLLLAPVSRRAPDLTSTAEEERDERTGRQPHRRAAAPAFR
jgi:hypothetical protein